VLYLTLFALAVFALLMVFVSGAPETSSRRESPRLTWRRFWYRAHAITVLRPTLKIIVAVQLVTGSVFYMVHRIAPDREWIWGGKARHLIPACPHCRHHTYRTPYICPVCRGWRLVWPSVWAKYHLARMLHRPL